MPLQAWLPDSALHGGAVDRVLRDVALRWSEKWFARQLLALVDASDCPDADHGSARRVHVAGVGVAASERSQRALAGLMLDVAVESTRSHARDRAFLHDLAARCLDDLCSEIGQAFGFDDPAEWCLAGSPGGRAGETTTYWLGVHAGAPVVEILVERAAAVALIKKQAPAGPRPKPLQPLSAALALQPVDIAARVGCCELNLADFAQLAPGDVVVLDHDLAKPLALLLGRQPTDGRCSIEQGDSAFHLKIVKPLRG